MKIGFIGLGIMGRPMAKNLLNAGVELLVSDLNKEAVADVVAAGAKEAAVFCNVSAGSSPPPPAINLCRNGPAYAG